MLDRLAERYPEDVAKLRRLPRMSAVTLRSLKGDLGVEHVADGVLTDIVMRGFDYCSSPITPPFSVLAAWCTDPQVSHVSRRASPRVGDQHLAGPPVPGVGFRGPERFHLRLGGYDRGHVVAPDSDPAPELVASGASLGQLREAAEGCTACELYRAATQVVFGAGP